MANTSAKKLVKCNAKRLATLQQLIGATNLVFAVVRAGLFYQTFTSQTAIAWAAFAVLTAVPYAFIASAARPSYVDGAIVSGGLDIGQAGVFEYAHDLIYITALVQVLFILTPFALVIFSVVPMYLLYVSCCSGCGAESQGVTGMDDKDMGEYATMSRKERRKMERESRSRR